MESAPDSPIRRALSEIDEQSLVANQRKAQLQRNFRAISEQAQQDPQKAAQLIGQLPEVLRDLSADQAIVTLGDLAMNYRQQSQFHLAESTYLELVRRHPDHPAAADAMVWLVTYWSSGEMAWQRSRERGQQVARPRIDTAALQNRIQQAGLPGGSLLSAPSSGEEIRPVAGTSDRRDVVRMTSPSPGSAPDSRDQWQRRALELVEQIGQSSPHLFQQPKVQLPLAALKRANNQPALADGIYRQFQGTEGGTVSEFLQRELWASQPLAVPPRQLAICKTTETRPFLDGILSDECWQEAAETPLAPPAIPGEESLPSGLIMFAYDQQFLYIAAIMKQVGERPVNTSEMGERDYDASLTGYDRLSLALDPDRDYVSSYQLQVDERGQTADQCWEDRTWNPKWFVARQADAERWQIEAAIPWNELAPNAPFPREVWAMSAVRTIPYTAYHGWGNSTTWPPAWHSFGLLRFE